MEVSYRVLWPTAPHHLHESVLRLIAKAHLRSDGQDEAGFQRDGRLTSRSTCRRLRVAQPSQVIVTILPIDEVTRGR